MALSAYTVTSWKTGDVLTATKLNNIESQVSALTKVFITNSTEDRYVTSKSAWGVVRIANNNNFSISNTGILDLVASPSFTDLTVSGTGGFSSISVGGNATIGGNLTITNKLAVDTAITFSVAARANSSLTVTGATALNGSLTVGGTATLNSTLSVTGLANFGALEATSISTGSATADKFTLSSSPASYALLDLVPAQYVTSYVTTTVPAWAREANKPTYTAAEIGAFGGYIKPSTGIPAEDLAENIPVSLFTNDANYLVASDIAGKANSADLSTVATSGKYEDLQGRPEIVGWTLEEGADYSSAGIIAVPRAGGSYYLTVTEQQKENEDPVFNYAWDNMVDWPLEEGDYILRLTFYEGIPTYRWVKMTSGGE